MAGRLLTILFAAAAVTSAGVTAVQADEPKPAVENSPPAPATYVCPMHPQIQATFPGTCPLCRMALKPTDPDAATGHAEHAHQGMNMGGMDMGVMNCPHCMMNMGGMSTRSAAAPIPAPGKVAPGGYPRRGGRRCGC